MTWSEVLRGLSASIVEVVKAELEVLKIDLARAGRNGAIAAAAVVLILFLGLYTVGVALYALIKAFEAWGAAPWAAPLWTLLVMVVVIAILGAVAWWCFKKSEYLGAGAAKRRLDEHLAWWQEKMLDAGDDEVSR